MEKIIDGKRYNTKTAKLLASDGTLHDDADWWRETLYRKSTGEYFLYGEGGPASRYARKIGQITWTNGSRIMPLTIEEAKKWVKEHRLPSKYGELFGEAAQAEKKKSVMFSLTASAIEKIARIAARDGISKSAVVEMLVQQAE